MILDREVTSKDFENENDFYIKMAIRSAIRGQSDKKIIAELISSGLNEEEAQRILELVRTTIKSSKENVKPNHNKTLLTGAIIFFIGLLLTAYSGEVIYYGAIIWGLVQMLIGFIAKK